MPDELRTYEGMRYEGQRIVIDGVRFVDCEFIDCRFVYRGGQSEAVNCKIHPNTLWEFEGPAATMMDVLSRYGWHFSYGKGEAIRFPGDTLQS